jgi:hypothetical protein
MYTLHNKHVEKHTHGNLVFYGHVLSLNVYKQQDFSHFIAKLFFRN